MRYFATSPGYYGYGTSIAAAENALVAAGGNRAIAVTRVVPDDHAMPTSSKTVESAKPSQALVSVRNNR